MVKGAKQLLPLQLGFDCSQYSGLNKI